MLQIGHPSLIPVGGFLLGNRVLHYMLRRLQKCHTPKNTKNMAGLHVRVLGGGVSLARRIASTNIFPYRRYRGTHKQPAPAGLTPPDTPSMFLHVYARA